LNHLTAAIGLIILLAFLYAAVVSILEHEYRAAKVSVLFAVLLSAPFFVAGLIIFPYQNIISWVLIGIVFISILILFIPTGSVGIAGEVPIPKNKIDERDIMFSRLRYTPGTDRYEDYYKQHPEYKILDDQWREKPGLLKKGSVYYDPVQFSASDGVYFIYLHLYTYIRLILLHLFSSPPQMQILQQLNAFTRLLMAK